jgi:predicted glycogen debranching enzyme
VGDRLTIELHPEPGEASGVRAFLRTNLTRAKVARREVVARAGLTHQETLTFAGASWRDIPLKSKDDHWSLDLPLIEVGHFRAKAYYVDAVGHQHWPEGHDLGISVHPNRTRSANAIYCAFPRTFGDRPDGFPISKEYIRTLDDNGYTVIPPSGTLRDLRRVVPHIMGTLNCRILHLLPIGPVPTTFARMGRFGSPYAQLDLTGIDPALVEFDRRTTGVEQFRELTDAVHLRDGLVFLDIVLNHTGWASVLWNERPEWFERNDDGTFKSPGAWGNIWADLVELDQGHQELWERLATSLITWCQRGVDGFRCDAGYMIPLAAWQYVVARVRQLFPNCVFLLEGLGGSWEATETLLTEGGMQWAYSELFQVERPSEVASYLDHVNRQSETTGNLVHYSETHDNNRLAARGAAWSRMRNHLSALTSHAGAFGFGAGVEWLSTEKFIVHEARPLAWGNEPNLVADLARLNTLLANHPCFFDGATVSRVSADDSDVLALERTSRDGKDRCLVLVNLDVDNVHQIVLHKEAFPHSPFEHVDLLGAAPRIALRAGDGAPVVTLDAGQSLCLASSLVPVGTRGSEYRLQRAQAAFAYVQLGLVLPHEAIGPVEYEALAAFVSRDPEGFLGCLSALPLTEASDDLLKALGRARATIEYLRVVTWEPEDANKITLIPPEHWLLVRDDEPFFVDVFDEGEEHHLRSTPMEYDHVVAVPPRIAEVSRDVTFRLDRYGRDEPTTVARLRRLPRHPRFEGRTRDGIVLLTNGRGAMVRLWANLGAVRSKYDCLLGANLHPSVPCDRHILVKRARVWVNADGFITPLDAENLVRLENGPPALWTFVASAGDGRQVRIQLAVDMIEGKNAVVLRFERVANAANDLPADRDVRLTVRLDLEDRNFHADTKLDQGTMDRFQACTTTNGDQTGFVFAPASDRTLRVDAEGGTYHAGTEWLRDIVHTDEAERGLNAVGDAYSPGWFELPLSVEAGATIHVSAESASDGATVAAPRAPARPPEPENAFERQLRTALAAFVVRRGEGKTVIAGYPWFLDWGRDTLVAVRGLVAAGETSDALRILMTFADLEQRGTLPNFLSGESTASRETSDAPLWFSLACEELAKHSGDAVYRSKLPDGRTLLDVLDSIAQHMILGTVHGVRVDLDSGLVFSPTHFTWMDTNYPPGTPREGYPIELSVLYVRLLRQLARMGREGTGRPYSAWADRTQASLELFYRQELGFYADTLHAPRGTPASAAIADDHLRPNHLLGVSLGLFTGDRARSTVKLAGRELVVPGAMRSLSPRSVAFPLPIRGRDGVPLNDPHSPYKGHYVGDEDTQRKPAYHNGTAWVWWLPTYCEALASAYAPDAAALSAAKSILASTADLLSERCLGQLPEILDGDLPHTVRGCDAQAWSVSETLRVWLALKASS